MSSENTGLWFKVKVMGKVKNFIRLFGWYPLNHSSSCKRTWYRDLYECWTLGTGLICLENVQFLFFCNQHDVQKLFLKQKNLRSKCDWQFGGFDINAALLTKRIPWLTRRSIFPHLVPHLIHTIDDDHSNDRYQNRKLKLTGYHFSHRKLQCGIFYLKAYSKQDKLVK